jgi:hypothetical protein
MNATPRLTRLNKIVLAVGILVIAFVAFTRFRIIHEFKIGERKLLAALNGDQMVKISRFETEGQQRRVRCTDTQVLDYLMQMLQKHPDFMTNVGGYSYRGRFNFTGGGSFDTEMSTSANGFCLSLTRRAVQEGIPTHCVPMIGPVPVEVRQLFNFSEEPEQTAAGTVLVFEAGRPPYRLRDESLVAR